MEYCQTEDPTIRDYCDWQRGSWCMDEILTMEETFSEEEMHLMDRFQPYNDVGKGQQEHSSGKALLEEALTSIGMRQLLPQISINHTSNMSEELQHLQYPPLGGRDAFCSQMPYFSSASVFVPVSNEPKNEMAMDGRKAASAKQWEPEPLHPSYSLLSSVGSGQSSSEACVPDLSPRAPLGTPRSSAHVPDWFHSSSAPEGGCQGAQICAALLCNTRQLRPRTLVKTEDDSVSSDDERRVAPSYDSLNETVRAVPGNPDSASALNRIECLQRYRDKKQRRHFSHKVRYTARKLNADRRPRVKGRFVKASDLATAAPGEL